MAHKRTDRRTAATRERPDDLLRDAGGGPAVAENAVDEEFAAEVARIADETAGAQSVAPGAAETGDAAEEAEEQHWKVGMELGAEAGGGAPSGEEAEVDQVVEEVMAQARAALEDALRGRRVGPFTRTVRITASPVKGWPGEAGIAHPGTLEAEGREEPARH